MHRAAVVQTPLHATSTAMQPLTMVHVSNSTSAAFAVAMESLKVPATVMATFWMTVVYAVATTQVAQTARALRMERLYSMTVAFAILHTSTTSSRTFQCTLKMRTH